MTTNGTVTVLFFAQAREIVGRERLEAPRGGMRSVGEVREWLASEYPGMAILLRRCAMAVNRAYARDDTPLQVGDEVAVIPPVAGG